jgi:hypothetical protein
MPCEAGGACVVVLRQVSTSWVMAEENVEVMLLEAKPSLTEVPVKVLLPLLLLLIEELEALTATLALGIATRVLLTS